METPEQRVKSVQSKRENDANDDKDVNDVILVSNFEQILHMVLVLPEHVLPAGNLASANLASK